MEAQSDRVRTATRNGKNKKWKDEHLCCCNGTVASKGEADGRTGRWIVELCASFRKDSLGVARNIGTRPGT